jgi:hypothetical protein
VDRPAAPGGRCGTVPVGHRLSASVAPHSA